MKRIIILSCVLLLASVSRAQETERPFFLNATRLQLGASANIYRFRGDEAVQNFSNSAVRPGFEFAVEHKSWKFSLPAQFGRIAWNNNGPDSLSNFSTSFVCTGLNFQWRILADDRKLSPFVGAGYNMIFFNVDSDLRNGSGDKYHLWKDGSIRDLEQLPQNVDEAKIIQRDYTYETRLLNNQRMTAYPLMVGLSSPLTDKIRMNLTYSVLFIQGDNLDNSVSQKGWDHLSSISLSLSWTIPPKRAYNSKPLNNSPAVDYSSVDFDALDKQDEDGDGVPDIRDKCFGTPKGAPVDENGCTSDSDADGIPDFVDAEPNSPENVRVHNDGTAWSDEEYQQYTNDSLSYFVQTLRKVNKNSRPFPVRKYIPTVAFQHWNAILEAHPEWIKERLVQADPLPKQFKVFDTDRNGFLSTTELENAVNRLFDGNTKAFDEDLLRKAIEYAFRNQ